MVGTIPFVTHCFDDLIDKADINDALQHIANGKDQQSNKAGDKGNDLAFGESRHKQTDGDQRRAEEEERKEAGVSRAQGKITVEGHQNGISAHDQHRDAEDGQRKDQAQ